MTLVQGQWRRGTAAEWSSANPVLLNGEPGWEWDTGQFKVGNGVDNWNTLPYFQNVLDVTSTFQSQIDLLGPRQIVTFLVNDTFDKADYPWLKYVKVTVIGGGGGGGGAKGTSAGEVASGGDGGGGGGAQDVIAATDLATSETVTVGAGGPGGIGGTNPVSNGGTSSFGAWVVATGGVKGSSDNTVTATPAFGPAASGGSGGVGTVGAVLASGSDGGKGYILSTRPEVSQGGGSSAFGFGGRQQRGNSASQNGSAGILYGGGGTAASTSNDSAKNGGAGAAGIVVVELFG